MIRSLLQVSWVTLKL